MIIIHELPGMTPACIRFAEEVVKAGFRVCLPLLFGDPGDTQALLNFGRVLRLCIRKEFGVQPAPIPYRIGEFS